METVFTGSHKTIEEHCTVISQKNHKILLNNLGQQICFEIGVCTPYTLLSQLCKFHFNWISSLVVPTV